MTAEIAVPSKKQLRDYFSSRLRDLFEKEFEFDRKSDPKDEGWWEAVDPAPKKKYRTELRKLISVLVDEKIKIVTLFSIPNEKNGALAFWRLSKLSELLIGRLKHFAFNDPFVELWLSINLKTAGNIDLSGEVRKISQKYLSKISKLLIPDLRKNKSFLHKPFPASLLDEYANTKMELRRLIVRQYDCDRKTHQFFIKDNASLEALLNKYQIRNLSRNQKFKITIQELRGNDQRALYLLSKKYLSSVGTIEKEIKKRKRQLLEQSHFCKKLIRKIKSSAQIPSLT